MHPEQMDQASSREEAKRLSGRASAISALLEIGRTPANRSLEEYQQFGRDLAAFAKVIDDESLDRVCRCARRLHDEAREWLDALGHLIEQGFDEVFRQDLIAVLLILNWAWGDVSSYWPAHDQVAEVGRIDLGCLDHDVGEHAS
jgi:hypothetical protein